MDAQLLFIEGTDQFQIRKVELMAEKAGIGFQAFWERDEALLSTISQDETNIKAAIIHLSAINTTQADMVILSLPETMRRIVFCEADFTAAIAKRTAIDLGADWILTPKDFREDPELITKIVERGMATQGEIEQRGKTIEINGRREENTVWSERDDMHGARNYGDEDYFTNARKGETDR